MAESRGVEVFFSGRVQGVGFRFTARSLAARYSIGGWIKNLSDGRVQLVATGQSKDVDIFLHNLKDEFKEYISDCIVQEIEDNEDYKDFQIKF